MEVRPASSVKGRAQCSPFPGIGPDAESNPATLRIKYGINPGISGIYPIPAARIKSGIHYHLSGTQLWLDRASWFAPNPCRESRQTRIGQVAPRRVSAAHLGMGPCSGPPPRRTVPARRPLCRLGWADPTKIPVARSPGVAPQSPGRSSGEGGGRPEGRAPPRRRCGGGGGRVAPGRRLLRALRAGANWPPPNSHPSTHGRDAPGDAIDRGHMEIKIQCSLELEFALFINLCFSRADETAQRVPLSELRSICL